MSWDDDGYWLARLLFQRGIGLIYLIAFINALNQFRPLLGERGLLPVTTWVKEVPFRASPSLFYFAPKDPAFAIGAWIGIVLSCLVVAGVAERYSTPISACVWAAIWLLYISFVNIGQTFYAFGWESILLEAGFYAAFLGSARTSPQFVSIILLRWLCFRVMFGAGLIKLRGDPCWHDMTCLDYHYETQPMPNPLSWFLHNSAPWWHRSGVWFNHFAELIAPFGYFLPQPIASVAGLVTIVFQGTIMISGNLSWLNLLTIVLAIPALDDRVLGWILPLHRPALHATAIPHKVALAALAVLIVWLSVNPVRNMLSPRQVMNTSYNPLHLVGTYGAFGSITRIRNEIVVEGAADSAISASTVWREYEFRGKPNATGRMPPQIAPYHLRLDWLMWFAAMSSYQEHPWFVHLLANLLRNDAPTLSLLHSNPFQDHPPKYVRALLYEYHFTSPDERRKTGQWWRRTLVGTYFPPVSRDSPGFHEFLDQQGWLDQ
jgi:hypothetical protein